MNVWLYFLLYLVVGIFIAYKLIPRFQQKSASDAPLTTKVGLMILLWGVLVPLGVIMSIPEILVKLHERKNK